MSGLILIVEDEVLVALSASMLLSDEGYTIVLAGNGEDGLTKARGESPTLIITDYMMPRMDGLTMIRVLRDEGVRTPVILASSTPEAQIVETHAERPYEAYLSKPYSDTALLELVKRLLSAAAR